MTTVTQIENGKAFTGEAFVEGYVKVRAADDITRYIRLTVDGRLFDAIPGRPEFYSVKPGTPNAKDVWVKTLTDAKTGFEIEVRTFDSPEEGETR